MTNRPLGALCAVAVVIGALSLAPTPAAGQPDRSSADQWTMPRTPDGQPDLQGVWANNAATPLERPQRIADKASLTDAELVKLKARAEELFSGDGDAAFGDSVFQTALVDGAEYTSPDGGTGNYNAFWVVDRAFDHRTSLIVDPPNGRFPPLTEEALTRQRAGAASFLKFLHPDGPEDVGLNVRCISYGAPYLLPGYNSYFQILQSATHVVIVQEMIHDARIIPLDDRPHLDDEIRQWHGNSRGHWEGDTLVVETRNYSSNENSPGLFRAGSQDRRVVERLTRVGHDTIHWDVTVDDPSTWTRPWTAMMPLKRSEGAVFEYACHEGNYALQHMLSGARAEDAR